MDDEPMKEAAVGYWSMLHNLFRDLERMMDDW